MAEPSSRADLGDLIGIIRQRIRRGNDKTLSALGLSLAGISYFLSAEYAVPEPAAEILAAAACELIQRYGA